MTLTFIRMATGLGLSEMTEAPVPAAERHVRLLHHLITRPMALKVGHA